MKKNKSQSKWTSSEWPEAVDDLLLYDDREKSRFVSKTAKMIADIEDENVRAAGIKALARKFNLIESFVAEEVEAAVRRRKRREMEGEIAEAYKNYLEEVAEIKAKYGYREIDYVEEDV